MKIILRIVYSDGTSKEVTCAASEFVKFEERFDISIAVLETQMKFTHLIFLAWAAESRLKATEKKFDEWVELVDAVEVVDSPK